MRDLVFVLIGGVCFWLGMAVESAAKPLPPVYVVKSDAPRCDLIDRRRKDRL